MRPHLPAVRAAAEVSRARVEGATLGSGRLVFEPGTVQGGDYAFDVGTAGSTTLVLQTVLPALMIAQGQSRLTLEGGTHNPLAPPFDFLARTFLPLVNRLGPAIEASLERPGFYPAGGGKCTVEIRPSAKLAPLELTDRGEVSARRVRALVSRLPRHIAERECRTIAARPGWDAASFAVEEVAGSRGPGNVVIIEIESEHLTEVFTAFGQRGVRAEDVAREAVEAGDEYLAADVPVGPHLADQLLLPLGVGTHLGSGGGSFRTMALSPHATTHVEVLRRFMEVDIRIEPGTGEDWLVRVGRVS